MLRQIINNLLDLILPNYCVLCDHNIKSDDYNLCNTCTSNLPTQNNTCFKCAISLTNTTDKICGKCQYNPPPWNFAIAPYEYNEQIKFIISSFKYRQHIYLGKTLAKRFIKNLPNSYLKPDLLIPVPLHKKRIAMRKFNQSQQIAKHIGKDLAIKVSVSCCYRVINTPQQAKLNYQQRKDNIKDAFIIKRPEMITNKHIAIVDDVYTTGATLEVISKLIKNITLRQYKFGLLPVV